MHVKMEVVIYSQSMVAKPSSKSQLAEWGCPKRPGANTPNGLDFEKMELKQSVIGSESYSGTSSSSTSSPCGKRPRDPEDEV